MTTERSGGVDHPSPLSEATAPGGPLELLRSWLDHARQSGVHLPNTMVVATATPDGAPSSRAVVLREVRDDGLVFYTDYLSRKARELEANPRAACLLLWPELQRQVRAEGPVSLLTPAESDAYFATREREAQIEAWASRQSAVIPDRSWLEKRFSEFEAKFDSRPVPRPDSWGGFRVGVESCEFWQGQPGRMHDRLVYARDGAGWRITRLAP